MIMLFPLRSPSWITLTNCCNIDASQGLGCKGLSTDLGAKAPEVIQEVVLHRDRFLHDDAVPADATVHQDPIAGIFDDFTYLLNCHNDVLRLAVVADVLMDRNDMRLGVSARALEPKQPPQGGAKNRVGEVSHGDFHNREGPGILKPVVLVEGQVPPVQIKITLRESFKGLHESSPLCAALSDISSDILFES
jgi:hypothetical protein